MQPSYALMPATSYPKTIGGMCYAIIRTHTDKVKQPLVIYQSQARRQNRLSQHASVDMLSQHAKYSQAIPVCSHPVIGWES